MRIRCSNVSGVRRFFGNHECSLNDISARHTGTGLQGNAMCEGEKVCAALPCMYSICDEENVSDSLDP